MSITVIPNTDLIVSGSYDATIKLWDYKSMQIITTLSGHSGAVNWVIAIPFADYLASGSDDKSIII